VLCKAIYRHLRAPSERYLDLYLRTADGRSPPLDLALAERFPENDPLTTAVS
jgi:hypothetical protein